MTVGGQVFSGKGAREEAAKALARAVLRRDDYKLQKRASFRGFEILSRDQPGAAVPFRVRVQDLMHRSLKIEVPIIVLLALRFAISEFPRAAFDPVVTVVIGSRCQEAS